MTKLNASGGHVWSDFIEYVESPAHFQEDVRGVAFGNDGSIFVTGRVTGDIVGDGSYNGGSHDIYVRKYAAGYDPNGPVNTAEWTRFIGTPAVDYAFDMVADDEGYIYVAGSIGGFNHTNGAYDLVEKLDPETGETVWSVTLGVGGGEHVAYGLDVDAHGDVYVTGTTRGSIGPEEIPTGARGLVDMFVAKIAQSLHGDFNSDGVVDAADYTVWRDNYGATGLEPYAAGDGTGDGNITTEDYDVWRSQYGMTLIDLGSSPASSLTVPEPSPFALLLITALQMDRVPPLLNGGCRRQRRWRRLIGGAVINNSCRSTRTCLSSLAKIVVLDGRDPLLGFASRHPQLLEQGAEELDVVEIEVGCSQSTSTRIQCRLASA